MIVIDFDGEDPLEENNLITMHHWMKNYLNDNRVINASGYALPSADMNESEVLQFWQTPEEFLDNDTVASREYLREQFISDNITIVIFSLTGTITGETSRDFVSDVRSERGE
jgi:hypothetical protein